jgi:hypothetical protein
MRSGKKGSTSKEGKSSHENKNKHITLILDQLQEIYEVGFLSFAVALNLRQLEGDQWRANSYKRVSSMLSRMKRFW